MPKCQISSKFGKKIYMNKGEESYSDVTAFCIDIFNIRFVLENSLFQRCKIALDLCF